MFDGSFYQLAVALFLLWVALLLTPGPDFIMMLRATVNYDNRHAVATGTGITTALGIYIALVIFGFELLYKNDVVYKTIKYAGAIYLIYIGIGTLLSKSHISTINKTDRQQSIFDSFKQGFVCNILNPKAPILIGSIFSQLIGTSTSTSLKLVFGIEMLLINLLVWGLFPNLIRIGIINRLLLQNTQRVNVALGIALCVLGGVAFL